jgi:mono/diheme cytochrome c family protein
MDVRGVGCEDCHMPKASKSAVAFGPYQGDVETHLFRINVARNGQMFTDDGNFVLLDDQGQGAVTLDFACRQCHTDEGSGWLAGKAKNFHQRGKN